MFALILATAAIFLPNRSQLERDGAQIFHETVVLPDLERFYSLAYKEICQQFFWQARLTGKLPYTPTQVGNWWNANGPVNS